VAQAHDRRTAGGRPPNRQSVNLQMRLPSRPREAIVAKLAGFGAEVRANQILTRTGGHEV